MITNHQSSSWNSVQCAESSARQALLPNHWQEWQDSPCMMTKLWFNPAAELLHLAHHNTTGTKTKCSNSNNNSNSNKHIAATPTPTSLVLLARTTAKTEPVISKKSLKIMATYVKATKVERECIYQAFLKKHPACMHVRWNRVVESWLPGTRMETVEFYD